MKLVYLVYFLILFHDVFTKHEQYHHKHKKKAKPQKQKKSYIPKVPRFEIPKHQSEEEPPKIENDFSPEAITITKQVGNIKDTELPGAFGADDALRELLDDTGSGEESGVEEQHTRSARHRKIKPKHSVVAEHHDTHAENAANFGSHLPGTPGMNPSAAFITTEENHDGIAGGDDIRRKEYKEHDKKYANKKSDKNIDTESNKNSVQNNYSVNASEISPSQTTTIHQNKVNLLNKTSSQNMTVDDESNQIDNQILSVNSEENSGNDDASSTPQAHEILKNVTGVRETTFEGLPANDIDNANNQAIITNLITNNTDTSSDNSDTIIDNNRISNISASQESEQKSLELPKSFKSKAKKLTHYQKDKDLFKAIQNIQNEIKKVEERAETRRKKLNKTDANAYQTVRHEVDNEMKSIQRDLQRYRKYKHKLKSYNSDPAASLPSELLQNSSHGGQEGPEGFECPWACMWACHSYCPKECCNNPFNCPLICREVCSPTCHNKCCAPGSRRLPKLKLEFKSEAETGKKQIKESETAIRNISNIDKTELAEKMKVIEKAQQYASQLLGLPASCPLFCNRICAPGLCRSECCHPSPSPLLTLLDPSNKNLYNKLLHESKKKSEKETHFSSLTDPEIAFKPVEKKIEFNEPILSAEKPIVSPTVKETIATVESNSTVKPKPNVDLQTPFNNGISQVQQYSTVSPLYQESAKTDNTGSSLYNSETYQYGRAYNKDSTTNPQQNTNYAQSPPTNDNNGIQNYKSRIDNVQSSVTPAPVVRPLPPASAITQSFVPDIRNYIEPRDAQISENPVENYLPSPKLEESEDTRISQPFEPPNCSNILGCSPEILSQPDYCPPICKTSCIDQCPNECCVQQLPTPDVTD